MKTHLDIEELARRKTFRELSEEEYAFVLRELGSASAYTTLRFTVIAVQEHFVVESEQLQPRPDTRTQLLYALQAKHRKPSVFAALQAWAHSVFAYKIPVWQTATVGVAALAIALVLPQHEQPVQPPEPRVVYVQAAEPAAAVHIDKEDIIQRVVDSLKDELTQQIRVQVAKEYHTERHRAFLRDTAREIVTAVLRSMEENGVVGVNNFVGLDNLSQLGVQKKGRTLAEDSSLSRFVVTAASERM